MKPWIRLSSGLVVGLLILSGCGGEGISNDTNTPNSNNDNAALSSLMAHGKRVFESSCMACHSPHSHVKNAPRLGVTSDWTARIAQGQDIVFAHAINGFNTMPAKGSNRALSDDDVKAAVIYLVNRSGGQWE